MVDEPRLPDSPDTPERPDGQLRHPLVHYERTDANHRWIIGLLGAAVVVGVLILAGLWWFLSGYGEHERAVKKSQFPLAPRLSPEVPPEPRPAEGVRARATAPPAPPSMLPPEPRLEQLDRLSGMKRTNAAALAAPREAVLNSYGPAAEEGYVHIPIDRAMQLLANKLPARAEAAPDHGKDNGLVDAGESNSGRMFRRSPR